MAVRVVTDSSSTIPPEIAQELDIEVLDLHVMNRQVKDHVETSTAGLNTLELVAAYARQLERGGDDGVVALHLSQELSSTHSAATGAAAVFDGLVDVIETKTVGMAVGAAAMAAARRAQNGADLEECAAAARDSLEKSCTWVYLHKIDDLRRSGRLSAGTTMLSAALLATKPIMVIADGKFELVGKTRTQSKAFGKLVELVQERASGEPAFIAIQHRNAKEAALELEELLREALPEGSNFLLTELSNVLGVHAGDGAIGVSGVFATSNPVENTEE